MTMIKEYFNNVKDCILDAFFPKRCMSCGEITELKEDFCRKCQKEIKRINLEKRCKFCGREKQSCDCKRFVHRFIELVAPFEYTGPAKSAMLSFKIVPKKHYSDFFAKNMAKSIIETYGDIAFDCICFVPTSMKSYLKRGFNPPEVIAKKLSKLLMVQLENVLFIKEKRKGQHLYAKHPETRFKNAAGKYGCNINMYDKTVLLIDDVATTGATLDDCTRALLFAGANKVYCATALVTVRNSKKLEKK